MVAEQMQHLRFIDLKGRDLITLKKLFKKALKNNCFTLEQRRPFYLFEFITRGPEVMAKFTAYLESNIEYFVEVTDVTEFKKNKLYHYKTLTETPSSITDAICVIKSRNNANLYHFSTPILKSERVDNVVPFFKKFNSEFFKKFKSSVRLIRSESAMPEVSQVKEANPTNKGMEKFQQTRSEPKEPNTIPKEKDEAKGKEKITSETVNELESQQAKVKPNTVKVPNGREKLETKEELPLDNGVVDKKSNKSSPKKRFTRNSNKVAATPAKEKIAAKVVNSGRGKGAKGTTARNG